MGEFQVSTSWWTDMSQGPHIPNRKLMRSLLVLCAIAFWTGGGRVAWATCGDYLHGHKPQATLTLDNLPDDTSVLPVPRPQHQPGPVCTGPQCQRHLPWPAGPTKVAESGPPNDAIVFVMALVDIRKADPLRIAVRPTLVVDGPANRIFRPPRAV